MDETVEVEQAQPETAPTPKKTKAARYTASFTPSVIVSREGQRTFEVNFVGPADTVMGFTASDNAIVISPNRSYQGVAVVTIRTEEEFDANNPKPDGAVIATDPDGNEAARCTIRFA